MNGLIKTLMFAFSVSLILTLGACGEDSNDASAPPMQRPLAQVNVAQVVAQEISEWEEYTGRLEAVQNVELRPRVSGYIKKVTFKEGAWVKKGTLLFKIDARSFYAEVNRLESELIRAQAQIGLAERDVKRAASLKQSNAISQEQLDNRNTQLVSAQAAADSVEAALRNARLNLSFTQVRAPISGRVSIANITEGNYVTQGESLLTTLVSTDHVYAYFDVDEQAYLQMKGQPSENSSEPKPVFMSLVNETSYQHKGIVDFIDNQIDVTTGTIRLRAKFDNAEGTFTPGMFARVKMRVREAYSGILIDDKAISTDLSHRYVLVLGEENKVEYRAVTLGTKLGGLRVIDSGLSAEDRILLNGLQRVRPGSSVEPTMVEMLSESDRKTLLQQSDVNESLASKPKTDSTAITPEQG